MPRPYIPPPEAQWLDNLAATQIMADSDVAHCWVLVRVGIQTLKVGLGNLGELIEHLRAGNGMMLDELMIEKWTPPTLSAHWLESSMINDHARRTSSLSS